MTPDDFLIYRQWLGADTWAKRLEVVLDLLEVSPLASEGLACEEAVAIYSYTLPDPSNGYRPLNEMLRGGEGEDAGLEAFGRVLAGALAKLPRWSGIAHRWTDLDEATRDDFSSEGIRQLMGFVSASVLPDHFDGADHMVIASLQGRYIASLSAYPEEHEVLFTHMTPVEILRVEGSRETGLNIRMAEVEVPSP